jgi:hypothetical protein
MARGLPAGNRTEGLEVWHLAGGVYRAGKCLPLLFAAAPGTWASTLGLFKTIRGKQMRSREVWAVKHTHRDLGS